MIGCRTHQYQRFFLVQKMNLFRGPYELETKNARFDSQSFFSMVSIYYWIFGKSLFVALFIWTVFYYLMIFEFRKSKYYDVVIYLFDCVQFNFRLANADHYCFGWIWCDQCRKISRDEISQYKTLASYYWFVDAWFVTVCSLDSLISPICFVPYRLQAQW